MTIIYRFKKKDSLTKDADWLAAHNFISLPADSQNQNCIMNVIINAQWQMELSLHAKPELIQQ